MKQPIQINYSAESADTFGVRINLLKWGVLFAFWTLFSILYANQIYFEMLHTPGMHHSWWLIAVWQLMAWYVWGALSPLIFYFERTFRVDGRVWLRGFLINLA